MKKSIVIISLFLSCKKSNLINVDCSKPTSEINVCKQLIIGNWNWQYDKLIDRLNHTYFYQTPSTNGINKRINFINSSEAIIYKNDILDKNSTYEITTLDKITNYDNDKGINVIIFYNKLDGVRYDYSPIQICNDSLTFNYEIISDFKAQTKWSKNK
jgi:hypothetical protein